MSYKFVFSLFLVIFTIFFASNTFSIGPGDKIENFSITNYDGKNYNLADELSSSGKGVIVMFWSTECPFVQPYNDRINDYVKEYSEKGFTVWAINSNRTESTEAVAEVYNLFNTPLPLRSLPSQEGNISCNSPLERGGFTEGEDCLPSGTHGGV